MRANFLAGSETPDRVYEPGKNQHKPKHDFDRDAALGAIHWLRHMAAALAIHRLELPLVENAKQDGRDDESERQYQIKHGTSSFDEPTILSYQIREPKY